jgi:AraC family transcriptional regulator
LAFPAWFMVRKQLAHEPIAAGRLGGEAPLFIERYLYQDVECRVARLGVTALVCQLGGSNVREGEPDHWRSTNLPTQSLLLPKQVPTHWHYSGAVDFAVFYFLDEGGGAMQRLEVLAHSRDAPMPFSDPLVSAAARQLVDELQRGAAIDDGFMERLAVVMLEQAYRALTTSGSGSINPRHAHFARLQQILNFVHGHLSADLSAGTLAQRAHVSLAHFVRIFRDATGTSPHRYVLSARLDLARKLLTQSTMPISRVAQECGFSSQSHLTACFRAAHSTTPAKYRARVKSASLAAGARSSITFRK